MPPVRAALALTALLALTACGSEQPSAAPSTPPTPAPELSETVELLTPVRLTGDGIDTSETLVAFGESYETAVATLVLALGPPSLDTGETAASGDYGVCPGSRLRALEFGDGALVLLFGDAIGPDLTLYQWALTAEGDPLAVPAASALVGDAATYDFRVGTPLGELRSGVATDMLTVSEGDELLDPSFVLSDQSSGFTGTLAGTTDADAVTGVQAGEPCGE